MRMTIRPIGNSQGIYLTVKDMDDLGLKVYDEVDVTIERPMTRSFVFGIEGTYNTYGNGTEQTDISLRRRYQAIDFDHAFKSVMKDIRTIYPTDDKHDIVGLNIQEL